MGFLVQNLAFDLAFLTKTSSTIYPVSGISEENNKYLSFECKFLDFTIEFSYNNLAVGTTKPFWLAF